MIKGFKMKLYPGQEAEYEKRHNELWQEMKDILLNGGEYQGRRILKKKTVRYMTQPQLNDRQRMDMWDSLCGYSYGKNMLRGRGNWKNGGKVSQKCGRLYEKLLMSREG